ncbi:MAG TPA: MBOAT family O-acyltransferase [Fibrobacteria bacterium]|nr:MBOAT family O-acyltransferase [Fibrobacteria bacterium]
MSFASLQFPFFFAACLLGWFVLPRKARIGWLLLSSCAFYMAFIPSYIFILFFLVGVDYAAGIFIEPAVGRRRKLLLWISIAANLGILATFKYTNFALQNLDVVARHFGMGVVAWRFPLVLPIGLSFHTFQSMAYTIEVYFGRRAAERNLPRYALYVLFWPQMVAGPIERPQGLLAQIGENRGSSWPRAISGLELMAWGFFKKLVIADRIAVSVDTAFADPFHRSGWQLALGSFLFAFQIYGDFSGYTDIARGAARVMGFDLCRNFDHPYTSRSPGEFWRRWHMSLSTWFRDYVYIPIGGNRRGTTRLVVGLAAAFLLSGLWHGAAWTFVIWGALHGAYVIVQKLAEPALERKPWWKKWTSSRVGAIAAVVVTFLLVDFAWIFFRSPDLAVALHACAAFIAPGSWVSLGDALRDADLRLALLLVAVLESLQWAHRRGATAWFSEKPFWVRWIGIWALLLSIVLLGKFGHEQFLYFQF